MKYKNVNCPICNQEISSAGAGYTAHMRKHVRNGEAIETEIKGKLFFEKTGNKQYVEPEPYAHLGEDPESHQPDGAWDITNALAELGGGISPSDYFVTSGEGVKKAEKLVTDAYSLAVKARAFRDKLESARGGSRYLETQREDGRILVKRKSPRKKNAN